MLLTVNDTTKDPLNSKSPKCRNSRVVRLLTCVLSLAPAALPGPRDRRQERNQRESNAWPDCHVTFSILSHYFVVFGYSLFVHVDMFWM